MKFLRESSPHMRLGASTQLIMFMVIVALIPAALVHILCFGWGLLWNLIFCTIHATVLEMIIYKLRHRPVLDGVRDFSVQVTVWLYCLAIPPYLSLWMTLLGLTFAVVIVKHAFGGLGQNTFNPAMAGFIFLLISVPSAMGGWVIPNTGNLNLYTPSYAFQMVVMDHNDIKKNIIIQNNKKMLEQSATPDAATFATPLNHFREIYNFMGIKNYIHIPTLSNISVEKDGQLLLASAYILGGLFLIIIGFINVIQPLTFLISIYGTGVVVNYFGIKYGFTSIDAWEHLFVGSTMIGAFFIITDPVSSPTTTSGKIVSAALIGFFTVIIRTFGSYPDAIAFAALLGNSFNPVINKIYRPRRFGTGRRARA